MSKCHCDEINEFYSYGGGGPDPLSDAGAMVYSELDVLMTEDIEFHATLGD